MALAAVGVVTRPLDSCADALGWRRLILLLSTDQMFCQYSGLRENWLSLELVWLFSDGLVDHVCIQLAILLNTPFGAC